MKARLQHFAERIVRNRGVQHLLFWALSYYIILKLTAKNSDIKVADYYYAAFFHLSLLIAVYVNLLVLIPEYLRKKRIFLYLLFVGLVIMAGVQLNMWTFDYFIDWILWDYYFISDYEYPDLIKFFVIYIAATTLLKLSKSWFDLVESERRIAQLEREKTRTELDALRSQINPHFLFNSLHNLYSLAHKRDPSTHEFILKLSDVMRYMIYEAQETWVPLEREIDYLKHYIALQKLRVGDQADIQFDIEGNPDGHKIAPLLLIPFVENSFKHGIKGETHNPYVHLHLSITAVNLTFRVENNQGTVDDVEKGKFGGIGLTNVNDRLHLLYPGRHQLTVENGDAYFRITLNLMLYENDLPDR